MSHRKWPRSARSRERGRFRFAPWARLASVVVCLLSTVPAIAATAHDPRRTATLYVLGFDPGGADRQGVYGGDFHEPVADSVAALAGLPIADGASGSLPANVVVGTDYYGDTPPSYYTAADVAEIDQVTAQWGGGVPRYAQIVAKQARRLLERSGAEQVNFVSASFGSLIVRWLIEKNLEGLAGEGRIARWLTIEGLVAGNWAASQGGDLVGLLSVLDLTPIDVTHMSYGWIEANLYAPRTEASHPAYAGILLGQIGSTDDSYNNAALRAAMLAYDEYQPSDGVQGLRDACFQTVTEGARFQGRPPTLALFHATHLGLETWRNGWAEAATFLTARRRVTVTMTSARVSDLHEAQLPFWNWLPAEVLWECSVYSPASWDRWAVTGPRSEYRKDGGAAPLIRFHHQGETRSLQTMLFDSLVLPEETELRLELHGWEVDSDVRYGVFEDAQVPSHDDMGGANLVVSTLQPGTYSVTTPGWSVQITVSVFDYPFPAMVGVDDLARSVPEHALTIAPNPSFGAARIDVPSAAHHPMSERAVLEITDVAGRVVRRLEGLASAGFHWDGRDANGRPLPAGVYLHRVVTPHGIWRGRSCLLR